MEARKRVRKGCATEGEKTRRGVGGQPSSSIDSPWRPANTSANIVWVHEQQQSAQRNGAAMQRRPTHVSIRRHREQAGPWPASTPASTPRPAALAPPSHTASWWQPQWSRSAAPRRPQAAAPAPALCGWQVGSSKVCRPGGWEASGRWCRCMAHGNACKCQAAGGCRCCLARHICSNTESHATSGKSVHWRTRDRGHKEAEQVPALC